VEKNQMQIYVLSAEIAKKIQNRARAFLAVLNKKN